MTRKKLRVSSKCENMAKVEAMYEHNTSVNKNCRLKTGNLAKKDCQFMATCCSRQMVAKSMLNI